MNAEEKAILLGVKVPASHGINWSWSSGLARENAELFLTWLSENGYESRGIYEDQGGCDVGWRKRVHEAFTYQIQTIESYDDDD